AAWPAVIYPLFRIGLWLAGGIAAVLIAAGLATVWDLLTDHHGVAAGQWSYTDSIPGPRFRGVPWWNYAGWALIASVTAGLTLPAL
ncbi:MAG: carotenoid biosynthesis protein, partial [Halobacteriaceae archaeon]